jgi:hypothetical protein
MSVSTSDFTSFSHRLALVNLISNEDWRESPKFISKMITLYETGAPAHTHIISLLREMLDDLLTTSIDLQAEDDIGHTLSH